MDSKLLAPKFNANPRVSPQAFSKAIDDDKRSVTSNESNQKAIRDRSSKVKMQRKRLLRLLVVIACPCVYVYPNVCRNFLFHRQTHTHTHTHTHTVTHTHTHTHTHTIHTDNRAGGRHTTNTQTTDE